MLALALTAGLALLVVGGVLELSWRGLTDPPTRNHLASSDAAVFAPPDYRDPARILDDAGKLRNAFVLVLETTLVVVALWLTVTVAVDPGVATNLKVAMAATLVVGGLLVGQGMYVRLGLGHDTPASFEGYRDSIGDAFGDEVAADFEGIHDAVTTARGETALDEVTVGVLAAARNGHDLQAVARWGERADLAVAETFEARAVQLADAGVVAFDPDGLRIGDQFSDATNEQLATVAASVLN